MSDLEAAVAAGVIGADEAHRSLLQATVEVARAIFGAKAASVFLLDEEAEELVFEAVAGEGEGELIGMRFPAGNGPHRDAVAGLFDRVEVDGTVDVVVNNAGIDLTGRFRDAGRPGRPTPCCSRWPCDRAVRCTRTAR